MPKSKNKRKSGTGNKGSAWRKKIELLAKERTEAEEVRRSIEFNELVG